MRWLGPEVVSAPGCKMCVSVTGPGKRWLGSDVKGIWVSDDVMKPLNQPRRDPVCFWTMFGEVTFPYCLSLWCVAKSTRSSLLAAPTGFTSSYLLRAVGSGASL